jgi:TetR/AcrR family tetracycline transcriptional repressor
MTARAAARPRASKDAAGTPRDVGTRRPRGRPARLSQDQIIEAAVALLDREPDEPLTIVRIAAEVEAVPAALYRHFESLDVLLDGVVARVLESRDFEVDERQDWGVQLGTWMRGLRAHLLRVPGVIGLIGRPGRTSPSWLETSSSLVPILARAGIEGRHLALAYVWVLETTIGFVIQETILAVPQQVASARAARDVLSQTSRDRYAPILPFLEQLEGDELFDFFVEQTTAAVKLRQQAARRR